MDFSLVAISIAHGGLDAFRRLLDVLPTDPGMAFVVMPKIDLSHGTTLADLLVGRTTLIVELVIDGLAIERNHLYIVPTDGHITVDGGAFVLRRIDPGLVKQTTFGSLLQAMAANYGPRLVAVILSGAGSDDTVGLEAVKKNGGSIVAQDPDEAADAGMPRGAIATGLVDFILSVAAIPRALIEHGEQTDRVDRASSRRLSADRLPEIVELLRNRTAHDFTLYRPGPLMRGIEQRMASAEIKMHDIGRYIDLLRRDDRELPLLAKNLLARFTHTFRDPARLDFLADKIIPSLIADHPVDTALRIWVPGCGTGEETYALAILVHEHILAMGRDVGIQIFASDSDADSIAVARKGFYSGALAADLPPRMLTRFFTEEDHGYRVSPELRASVVFTVQDILADLPFSRLDLICCRTPLVQLRPEAQAKIISLFHFALRDGGMLFLGESQRLASLPDRRFATISAPERLYRRVGSAALDGAVHSARPSESLAVPTPPREAAFAALCRRLVLELYGPAAVLINRQHECLYFLGPMDRYLRVAPGHPTHDLLAMAHLRLRAKLRAAIEQASDENRRIVVPSGGVAHSAKGDVNFRIVVQPVPGDIDGLLLICFIDEPHTGYRTAATEDTPRIAVLEQELEATRQELQSTVRALEISNRERKAITEEALSANEEYQSVNEELITSTEELQSLNDELRAVNTRLEGAMERLRAGATDLRNILASMDIPILVLDVGLNIRFFTPAMKALFNIIPSDVGRPIADLTALTADETLIESARSVLQNSASSQREVETLAGAWYLRRLSRYRGEGDAVDGIVITFIDITERRRAAEALGAAKAQAEQANIAKSRFLAAASHDLRQPLQTLSMLQRLLPKTVDGDDVRKLTALLDQTLSGMSNMLDTLVDISRIDAGTIRVEKSDFRIADLLVRLRDEFAPQARGKNLQFRVATCGQRIHSDPIFLEQMIRHLLSNALKYTGKGKILLGCRRRGDRIDIEIWDTGMGLSPAEVQSTFAESDRGAEALSQPRPGFGLGFAIVRQLATLLGHTIRVRSKVGQGSTFTIEIEPGESASPPASGRTQAENSSHGRTAAILVVGGDTPERDLFSLLLKDDGHEVTTMSDGFVALDSVTEGLIRPDLLLADYRMARSPNGLQLAANLRKALHRDIPVIILTGDVSSASLHDIARYGCMPLHRSIAVSELTEAVQNLLAAPRPQHPEIMPDPAAAANLRASTVYIVDDDPHVRHAIRGVLEDDGWTTQDFSACEEFLDAYRPGGDACLLLDAHLPGMSGLDLLRRLKEAGDRLPSIMITGKSDVPMAIQAMKAGAVDFIEKPIGPRELILAVESALEQARDSSKISPLRGEAVEKLSRLTARQRQVMERVLAGQPSKIIAVELGISQRTVEFHRAAIIKKTGTKSLPALARLALAAR